MLLTNRRHRILFITLAAMEVAWFLPFALTALIRMQSEQVVLPALLVMGLDYRELRRASVAPDAHTHHGIRVYKAHLHDCIWRGAAAIAVAVAVTGIIGGGLGALGGVG